MAKELSMLETSPPPGAQCWKVITCRVVDWSDEPHFLAAQMCTSQGQQFPAYDDGVFKLEIAIPERYPFEPPKMRFVTPTSNLPPPYNTGTCQPLIRTSIGQTKPIRSKRFYISQLTKIVVFTWLLRYSLNSDILLRSQYGMAHGTCCNNKCIAAIVSHYTFSIAMSVVIFGSSLIRQLFAGL